LDDFGSAFILEKNELMYLVGCLGSDNDNARLIADFTGIAEADSRSAVAGLSRKNIVAFSDGKLVTVKLYGFLIKTILSAGKAERAGSALIFRCPKFAAVIEEHALSGAHVLLRAFRGEDELSVYSEEAGERG
jgi:hypothetical protein